MRAARLTIRRCWRRRFAGIVGVVEHGLFLGMASLALVARGGWREGIAGLGCGRNVTFPTIAMKLR